MSAGLRFGTEAWAEKLVTEIISSGMGQVAYRVANQDVFRRMVVVAGRRRGVSIHTIPDYFGNWSVCAHDASDAAGRKVTRSIRATIRTLSSYSDPEVIEAVKQGQRESGEFSDPVVPGVEPPDQP